VERRSYEIVVVEPFADVVCRVQGESAEILNPDIVRVARAEELHPFIRDYGTPDRYLKEFRQLVSGGRALLIKDHHPQDKALARVGFDVPSAGRYHLFILSDAWCCGCSEFRFRIDSGPERVVEWLGYGYGWHPLGMRPEGKQPIPEPFDLAAGRHALDVLYATPICGGMIIDELVVAAGLKSAKPRVQSGTASRRDGRDGGQRKASVGERRSGSAAPLTRNPFSSNTDPPRHAAHRPGN
jgi:hypothetical protein